MRFGGPHGLSVDYVPLLRLCSVKLLGDEAKNWVVQDVRLLGAFFFENETSD